ncbi:hypothetical protein [Nonomuraea jiangxiensis]|uniref:DUF3806 domain-containing protein n=1 Tax=Nonomuraea jiangxiensis TaxID=633440 RepID=A0A1G9DBJ9_9ACTN|nr:hypothetical protein [Nonomuraea jiangxiensis]SDK61276.1 hypothetical protein SAMN05421869_11774 [Nonomuraea jiangxiensis]
MNEEELRQIAANVRLVIERLGPLSGMDFGLDRESVEWVEGFIERRRTPDAEQVDGLVSTLGSYLGACVIAATGGSWHKSDDHGWGVLLPNGGTAFPFAKVRKQLRDGVAEGESIAGFYRVVVDFIATGKMQEASRATADPAPRATAAGE